MKTDLFLLKVCLPILLGIAPLANATEPTGGAFPSGPEADSCHQNLRLLGNPNDEQPLAPSEISFNIYGSDKNPPLVLIHGLDSAQFTFGCVVNQLAERYRVITYDQRGHGRTAARGVNYSSTVLARDLKSLLDHLGISSAHILGHSMGGRTAMQFAALYPETTRSVVIEDMDMQSRLDGSLEIYTQNALIIKNALPERFESREALAAALAPLFGPEQATTLAEERARQDPADGSFMLEFRPYVSLLYGSQGNSEDFGSAMQTIRAPVLFLVADPQVGTAMSEEGLAHIHANLPHAEVVMVPGAGHSIHWTKTPEFLNTIGEFLARVEEKK